MSLPERLLLQRRFLMISSAVLLAAGFGLTLLIFYPGVMTYDAKFVYGDIAKGTMGDWQSPVMVWLWGLIDPIAPGAASMFLLIATTYWLGFGVLSLALASRGKASALLLPLLAMTPPALAFAGIIWRDVLLAACWLLAATIAFAASERPTPIRWAVQVLAFAFVTLGVLLRPNALLAAPILAAYIVSISRVSLRKTAIFYIPAVVGFFGIVQLVYYGMLDAKRQHPLQTIMIFDLGGISHFAKENQFPVDWSELENAMLLNSCYQPTHVGHLLAARSVRFCDGQGRARKRLIRYVGDIRGLVGSRAPPSDCLSAAPLGLHVEFSSRRQSDDVDG